MTDRKKTYTVTVVYGTHDPMGKETYVVGARGFSDAVDRAMVQLNRDHADMIEPDARGGGAVSAFVSDVHVQYGDHGETDATVVGDAVGDPDTYPVEFTGHEIMYACRAMADAANRELRSAGINARHSDVRNDVVEFVLGRAFMSAWEKIEKKDARRMDRIEDERWDERNQQRGGAV